MPRKKNATNRSNKSSHAGRNSTKTKTPGRPGRYEGYDESKASNDPSNQDDFDVDETDIAQRKNEYDDSTPENMEKDF